MPILQKSLGFIEYGGKGFRGVILQVLIDIRFCLCLVAEATWRYAQNAPGR